MALHHRDVEATWVLEVGGETIETTDEHPFFVAGKGWTEAQNLQAGDLLVAEGGDRLPLDKIERVEGNARVYNFEVRGLHSYFVGTVGVVVHNCGKAKPPLAQPGEDLFVGTYNQSRRGNIKSGLNQTHTPHHAVQDAVSTTTHGTGVTINLRKDLHELTETMRSKRKLPTRRAHLAADVWELRRLLKNAGYDPAVINRQLQELVRQNKAAGKATGAFVK